MFSCGENEDKNEEKEELTKDSHQLLPIDIYSESALYPGNVYCEFIDEQSARNRINVNYSAFYEADGSYESVFIEVYAISNNPSLNNQKLLDVSILKQNGGLMIHSKDVSQTNHDGERLSQYFVSNSSFNSLSEGHDYYSNYNNISNTNTIINLMGEAFAPVQIPVRIFGCWYTLHMKPNIM